MKGILVFFTILAILHAGDIITFDIKTDYNNVGKMTTLSLKFILMNPNTIYDYIRIDLPTGLNINYSSTYDAVGDWAVQGSSCDPIIFNSNQILFGKRSSQSIVLKFLAGGAPVALTPATNYTLRLKNINSYIISPGLYSPFTMYSTPIDDVTIPNFYRYDQTLYAGMIELLPAPKSGGLSVTLSQPNGLSNLGNISQVNYLKFSITASVYIISTARVKVAFKNQNLAFVAAGCMLDGNKYSNTTVTFTYDALYNLQLNINQTLNETLEFRCLIQNPNYAATDSLLVQTLLGFADTIVEETNVTSSILTVLALNWDPSGFTVAVGWGYDISNTSTLPQPMRFYRSTTANPVYNTVWFYFQNGNATSLSPSNQVVLQLVNNVNMNILKSSITTNLPASNTSLPQCVVGGDYSIVCNYVGPIVCTTCKYYIALKFAYLGTSDLTLPATFGKISMTTDSGFTVFLASGFTFPTQFQTIVSNLVLYTSFTNISDPNFTGDALVHTVIPDTSIDITQYSLIADPQGGLSLVFRHFFQKSWVTSGSLGTGDGIEYFGSPQILPTNPAFCNVIGAATQFSVCEAKQIFSGNRNMTRFRASPSSGASSLFPTTQNTVQLNFSFVTVNKISGLKIVDDSIFDFYGRTVSGALTTGAPDIISTASTQNFLINGYSVSLNPFSFINISLSSVWNNGSLGNTGTMFPTVLVMRGQFTDDEADTANTLTLFFSGLKPFNYPGNYSCGFSSDIPLNCRYFDEGLNPYNPLYAARIEIEFLPALNFATRNLYTLAIPLIVSGSASDFVLGLAASSATLIGNDKTPTHLKIYNYLHVNVNQTLPIINPSDRILIPVGITYGQEDITGTTSIPLNFINHGSYNPSIGNLGAGVQLCMKWNGISSTNFRMIFPGRGVGTPSYCAKYNYTVNGLTQFCAQCSFELETDTTTKDARIQSLIYPGYILPYPNDFMIVYSDNTSAAIAIKNESLSTRMNINIDVVLNAFISNPANLTYNSYLNKISMAFTPAAPIPPNPSFQLYINSDGNFNTTLVPLSTQCSIMLGFDEQLCNVTGTSILLVNNIPSYYVGTQQQIQINVDGINIDSIAQNKTFTSTFSVKILSSGVVVQQNWEFQNGTFQLYPSTSPYGPISEIILNDVRFVYPVTGFPSRLVINFFVPKGPDNSMNYYYIQLPFTIQSSDLNTICHIIETFGMSLSYVTCNLLNATTVQIVGFRPNSIPFTTNLTAWLDHITVPSSSPTSPMIITHFISGILVSYGSKVIDFNISNPSQVMPITFTKHYNTPGDSLELIFSFRAPAIANYETNFYIHFPYYYPESVFTKHLSCLVESIKMHCIIAAERTILIQGSLLHMEPGDLLEILIYGVVQPYTTNVGNITVVMNNGSNVFPFDFLGHVTDILPNNNFISFGPENITMSTTSLRAFADYTIFFNFTLTVPSEQLIITVPLPHSFIYDVFNQDTSVTCTLQSFGASSFLYLPFCRRLASRIKISVSQTLPRNTLFRLVLKNILNPDLEICNANKLMLSFAYANESNILATTIPNTLNMPSYSYQKIAETKQILLYTYIPQTGAIAPVGKDYLFTVTRGTISLPIQVFSQDGQYFTGDTQFFVNQLYFGSVSGISFRRDIIISQGYSTAKLLIGCETNTVLSQYEVKIGKGEFETKAYAEPPRITIMVITTPVVIPVDSTYQIPQGGFSLPLLFNFRNYLPYEYVGVKITIPDSAITLLKTVGNSEIQISRLSQIGYLQIQADSAVDLGGSFTLQLSFTGRNAPSYVFSNPSITITFFSQNTEPPVLKIITPEKGNSTTQLINVVTDHSGTMYYAVYINQTTKLTCSQIYKQAILAPIYNLTDPTQMQYGMVFLPKENIINSFTVFNLMATATYTIAGCLQSQMGVWSDLAVKVFSMQDNNSTITKMNITYKSLPSQIEEEKFLCFVTQYFQMPKPMIISEFGVYCGYKTPQLSNWTYSRPNLTGFPSYNSILYYVYTDKSQEAGDLRPTNLQNEITDLMNPKTKLGSKLASFMNSSTTFQGISGITIIGTIPTDPPRISGTISIGSGNTWISLQNISLDDNGYLIAGARRGYLPSFYEVLLDYNKNISTYNASSSNNTIQNYAGKVSSTIKGSFNFTNLTENSTYYLAIYSKNLDDTFLTNPSDPLIIILQTNEQPIITVLSSAALHVSLFVILMSFFFIML